MNKAEAGIGQKDGGKNQTFQGEGTDNKNYANAYNKLLDRMGIYTSQDCMVAFSGGVDSSVLLKLACNMAAKKGTKVHAVTVQSELHPVGDLEISRRVAKEIGAEHHVVEIRELKEAGIENNPVDRCYLCKKYLFSNVIKLAGRLDVSVIVEGTNEDDLHVYRPGIRAVRELGLKSPLAEAGMTKEMVRRLAAELSLSVASRPATPCLATRFPYGTALTMESMHKVELAEDWLRRQGYHNVRVRVHGDIARLEVDKTEFAQVLEQGEGIIMYLKGLGYGYVTLDLEGFRSGSMDKDLNLRSGGY